MGNKVKNLDNIDSVDVYPLNITHLDELQQLHSEMLENMNDPFSEIRINQQQLAWEMKRFRQQLIAEQRYICYVAKHKDDIVAYVAAVIEKQASFFKVDAYATITEIFVIPQLRKKGIATTLIKTLTEQLRAMGISWINVHLPGDAVNLQYLFDKLNYQVAAIDMRHCIAIEEEILDEKIDDEVSQPKDTENNDQQ